MAENSNLLSCILCDTDKSSKLKFIKKGYKIYHCSNCDLGFVYPRPSKKELSTFYDSSFFNRGNKYSTNKKKILDANKLNDITKWNVINNYVKSGKLLDVGCAVGDFLNLARKYGMEVSGVEISEYAVKQAKKKYDLEVHCGDLLSYNPQSEFFDLITMWDVIEHLADIESTISRASNLLELKGYLAFSTPDIGSTWASLVGKRWRHLIPPFHLNYFSQASITFLLEKHNFEVVEFVYSRKYTSVEFATFKLREMYGSLAAPFKTLSNVFELNSKLLKINFYDLMTCICRKKVIEN